MPKSIENVILGEADLVVLIVEFAQYFNTGMPLKKVVLTIESCAYSSANIHRLKCSTKAGDQFIGGRGVEAGGDADEVARCSG